MSPALKKRLRAVLYGRVSRDGPSVDAQLGELQRRAEAQRWRQPYRLFRDDGISASRFAKGKVRPDWQEVMEIVSTGGTDILAATEISRDTRDRAVWAALMAACIDRRVLIDVSGRTHDPADPDDGFMLDLQAAFGVRESALISKRVKRSVQSRANDGTPHGKLPYGYRREYDSHTGALLRQVLDEQQAQVMREIAGLLLAGQTLYTVAADLNRRGIPSPAAARSVRLGRPIDLPWTALEVRARAISPTIAGLRVHQGKVAREAVWPGIISAREHHALVALLTDPARKTWRAGGSRHLLPGIALCGVCDGPIRRFKNNGLPAYNCGARFCVSRRQDWVDAFVEEMLLARLELPDVATLTIDLDADESDSAAAELAELRARLAGFADSAADGGITPASLARIETKLLPAIADAEKRAAAAGVPHVVRELVGPHARALWGDLEMSQRRQVVRAFMEVRIHRADMPGSRYFDPSKIVVTWR